MSGRRWMHRPEAREKLGEAPVRREGEPEGWWASLGQRARGASLRGKSKPGARKQSCKSASPLSPGSVRWEEGLVGLEK